MEETAQTTPEPPVRWSSDIRHQSLCKYFINTGQCPNAPPCRFSHPPITDLPRLRADWVKLRIAQRRLKSHRPDDPTPPDLKYNHSGRAHVFAKWIANTFPNAKHVIDVAGGKGLVGLLVQRNSMLSPDGPTSTPKVTATLVDPRPRGMSNQMRRALDTTKELNEHIQEWFTDPPTDRVLELLRKEGTVVVGMHPDQATEAIVDVAFRFGVPWAVVPCCVFPGLHPERIIDGELVTSTEGLVEWLKKKRIGEVREGYLGFEGRNRVVYWEGPMGGKEESDAIPKN
ncbi:hypothetical protein HDU79_001350 [Rhizoclosmatium sp. JEL0117]|nr:hypothetical protein HDU79_001350 [Rhizoclosmatium sp. JEL0117]